LTLVQLIVVSGVLKINESREINKEYDCMGNKDQTRNNDTPFKKKKKKRQKMGGWF
jgi:hypothetical protein